LTVSDFSNLPEGKKRLNDDGVDADMKMIKEIFTAFCNSKEVKKVPSESVICKRMANQIKGVDLQRIDMGIAMAHFELAAREKGIKGNREENIPEFDTGNIEYVISWVS